MTIKKFDSVVIAGGNIKGVAILGSLHYCMENNIIDNEVKYWVGTSIGAIICYMIAIGFKPEEILIHIIKNRGILQTYTNVDYISMVNATGAASYDKLQSLLERITIEKTGRLFTLKQIKDIFGMTLVCVTYNYTKRCAEYLNPDDNPDIPAIIACKMSSNIPIYFDKFKYGDSFYIDGGIHDNFAIDYPFKNGMNHPLGFNIHTNVTADDKMSSYLFNLYKVMSNATSEVKIEMYHSRSMIIELRLDNLNLWDADYKPNSFLDLYSCGYTQTEHLIENDEDLEESELC